MNKYDNIVMDAVQNHVSIAVTDAYGVIVDVNEIYVRLSGYDKDELLGAHFSILDSGVHDEEFYQAMVPAIEKYGFWNETVCNRCKDGTLFWVNTTVKSVVSETGEVDNYVATQTDVTNGVLNDIISESHNGAIQSIIDGKSLAEAIQDILEHLFQVDPSLKFSVLSLKDNKTLHNLAGIGLSDTYSSAIEGLEIGPDVGSCGTAAYSKKSVSVNDINTHPNWTPFVELTQFEGLGACFSVPIMGKNDTVFGTMAIYAPEPRKLSNTLIEVHEKVAKSMAMVYQFSNDLDKLQASKVALKKAMNIAQRANNSKSHFLASMSHDLRTPLNAIMGFAEMVKNKYFGNTIEGKNEEYLNLVYTSGKRMLLLINDILDLSKVESGEYELDEEELNFNEFVNDLSKEFGELAKISSVTVDIKLPETPVMIFAEEKALCQMYQNITSNALKFSSANDVITISILLNDDGGVTLSVADEGTGFNKKGLKNLAEPFYSENAYTTVANKGTGLGLFITKRFAELHDAELTVRNRKNKGAMVEIIFPPSRVL